MTGRKQCAMLHVRNLKGTAAMADQDNNSKPEADADPAIAPKYRPAAPGVKDEDENVTTAGGEPINGLIADIADGDT